MWLVRKALTPILVAIAKANGHAHPEEWATKVVSFL